MAKSVDRDINNRIKAICDVVFNGNLTQMAKATYISRTTLISITGEQQSAPGYDVLRKIVEMPTVHINERWLLTGNGEMVEKEKATTTYLQANSGGNNLQGDGNTQNNAPSVDVSKIKDLETEIANLQLKLQSKEDLITEMRNTAAEKDARIAELKERVEELKQRK